MLGFGLSKFSFLLFCVGRKDGTFKLFISYCRARNEPLVKFHNHREGPIRFFCCVKSLISDIGGTIKTLYAKQALNHGK